jgi:hypothetical protein
VFDKYRINTGFVSTSSTYFLAYSPYFEKMKGAYEDTMLSVYPFSLLKARIVEPEETAVTVPCKHTCDVTVKSES